MITETEISMYTGYNGCRTTTCRTPDDAFISWVDGSMTTMGESQRGAHSPNNSLENPKTKVKVGCWNVRTMFSVGKTAQITAEITRYGIGILGISECRWSGFGRSSSTSSLVSLSILYTFISSVKSFVFDVILLEISLI